MNIRYASLFASLLFALSASAPVQASEDAPLPTAPGEMTQEEYDAYRARVREQMEAAQQAENKDDEAAATTTRRNTGNGYGQGYRARQERAGGNGAMGRTGGRGR